MDVGSIIRGITIYAIPAVLAIILHEIAHGWVAEKFGDSTARRAGRITLNPISHIDPIGTVILPLILVVTGSHYLFGWAKPVPVNFGALRNPKRDMIWVALAGPGTNFLLAMGSAVIIRVLLTVSPRVVIIAYNYGLSPEAVRSAGIGSAVLVPIIMMLAASILVNSVLMVINLIPVPPLDGGRIAVGVLPTSLAYSYARIERFGFLIIVLLLFVLPFTRDLFGMVIMVATYLFSLVAGVNVISMLF